MLRCGDGSFYTGIATDSRSVSRATAGQGSKARDRACPSTRLEAPRSGWSGPSEGFAQSLNRARSEEILARRHRGRRQQGKR